MSVSTCACRFTFRLSCLHVFEHRDLPEKGMDGHREPEKELRPRQDRWTSLQDLLTTKCLQGTQPTDDESAPLRASADRPACETRACFRRLAILDMP